MTYIDRFGALAETLPGGHLPWLRALRAESVERFSQLGLPTPRVEAWKYTNLNALTKASFVPAAAGRPPAVTPEAVAAALPKDVPGHRLVFVNGSFDPALSEVGALPQGAVLTTLRQAVEADGALLEEHLGKVALLDGEALLALNTAFMNDGVVLRLPRGVRVEDPIHIVFIGHEGQEPVAFHPRNLLVLEPGSEATVLETHLGSGVEGQPYWSNPATEVVVGKGAILHHFKVQREAVNAFHIATTHVHIEDDATYDSFVLQVGGRIARNEIHAALDGSGVTCRLNGGYLARGTQHIDNTTEIDHRKPHSASKEVYKGVLDDRGRGVFQGKITVRQAAQKTNGHQLNQTLLLSDAAEVDTKPQLEIYADDVKCSHGATAGELDEDALFYLRARGIDGSTARSLLIEAFLGELIEEVPHPGVQDHLRGIVSAWLGNADHGADNA